jgi:hypothetical protein
LRRFSLIAVSRRSTTGHYGLAAPVTLNGRKWQGFEGSTLTPESMQVFEYERLASSTSEFGKGSFCHTCLADHDPTNPTMKRAAFSIGCRLLQATGSPTRWRSDAALVWGSPLGSGAPAASDGRRRCWPTGRARAADDGAFARSPGAAPARPPVGPLDSWPLVPGTDRSWRPNRRAYPGGPTLERLACAAIPRSQAIPASYLDGPPHGRDPQSMQLATAPQTGAPDRRPDDTELGEWPVNQMGFWPPLAQPSQLR